MSTSLRIRSLLLCLCFCACPTDSSVKDAKVPEDLIVDGEASPDSPNTADWVVRLDSTKASSAIPPAILGQYDLSGVLFSFDKVDGLASKMKEAGFAEWRVGVGRWEIATQLLPKLTDGSSCATALLGLPPEAFAPQGASDLSLIADRDWFTYTDGTPVTKAMTDDDDRYALGYVREVIDVVSGFGATPFVNIDLMPRALSAGKSPERLTSAVPEPCTKTFSNSISNATAADPEVFAAAVVGMVKRIVEGSGGEAGRDVAYWEIWNEPEFPHFWDKRYEPKGELDEFFKLAVLSLFALGGYRATSPLPQVKKLRFGMASFAVAETAAATLEAFDKTPLPGLGKPPLDFVSFHSYHNDPLEIVADIEKVAAARDNSEHYKQAELVLAEWGPTLDGKGWDPASMDLALLVSTTLALGAPLGLQHAHHAIFWDFYEALPFGLLDHAVQPKPLYHAYVMLAAVIGNGNKRLPPQDDPSGRLEGGKGAVLASRGDDGVVRVLLINNDATERSVQVALDGKPATPSKVTLFDKPTEAPTTTTPSAALVLPSRSLTLVEL